MHFVAFVYCTLQSVCVPKVDSTCQILWHRHVCEPLSHELLLHLMMCFCCQLAAVSLMTIYTMAFRAQGGEYVAVGFQTYRMSTDEVQKCNFSVLYFMSEKHWFLFLAETLAACLFNKIYIFYLSAVFVVVLVNDQCALHCDAYILSYCRVSVFFSRRHFVCH